eukprot:6414977-Karenia_brevis.AAC.1
MGDWHLNTQSCPKLLKNFVYASRHACALCGAEELKCSLRNNIYVQCPVESCADHVSSPQPTDTLASLRQVAPQAVITL